MPDTMIERVARSLLREKLIRDGHREGPALDAAVNHEWANFAGYARVALKAMREPTEGMIRQGEAKYDESLPRGVAPVDRVWLAMIDAALAEGA